MKDIDTKNCSLKKRYIYICINVSTCINKKRGFKLCMLKALKYFFQLNKKKWGANILGRGILGRSSPNTLFSPLSILTPALRRRAPHKSSTSIIRREEQDGLSQNILWESLTGLYNPVILKMGMNGDELKKVRMN